MALGRPQIVTTDNAFTFWGDTPSNSAAVASNRLSRDRRIGRVAVSNSPDADAHRGFGPFPPIAVGEAKRYFGPKVIKPYARNAAQQRWTQRRPKSFYTEAVVIGQGIAFGGPAVLRTRIRPAPIHSKLRPPVVVNPEVVAAVFTGPSVTLAPAPKPRTRSRLFPPTAVLSEGVAAPVTVTLAPSRRPVTKSRLGPMGPPALVHAPLSVNLTYSRRGKPLSGLGRPVVLNPNRDFPQGPMVSLAPQRRGKPKSSLKPPTVLRTAAVLTPISVTLAPSHRGRTRSLLKPPTVVRAAPIFFEARPTLARIRPARVHSILRAPRVVFPVFFAQPTQTTFARIRPARVHSLLKPPTVVRTAVELSGPEVTLAPQSRRPGNSFLRPMGGPAVVYAPISVNLTYSRRGRPIYFLTLTEATIEICFGTVTGFDFAPTVCGDDEGLTVEGFDVGAEVCGDDEGPTAGGASAPGGSVTGGDARREGC